MKRLTTRPSTAVVLTPHRWYRSLCDQFPRVMARLFQSCRVLLPQGAPACSLLLRAN
ncbi:MAG: hypothetical protein HY360_01060 [Verrucomicrobia bacterium]|nr:hypothetical protein [Verrucomicrobiota bacterium]